MRGVFLTTEDTENTEAGQRWWVARETGPLTPGPSPPFRGRGEDVVFAAAVEIPHGTPRPWKGRGDGGEG